MPDLILNNKPLVEAIFELRWQLLDEPNGYIYDPHYKLLVGQVYEKIKHIYPFHQTLPQASMPDEISAYIVQHRFRIEENKWPLMQIGPGIITLNETQSYHWDDFKKRIADLIDTIFSIYPSNNSGLKPNGLLLRYINAIDFNFGENDIFAFFKDQLKTNITFHESLFHETGVKNQPYGFDFKFTFPTAKPTGTINLRFARGKKDDKDALIWETQVQYFNIDVPEEKSKITVWVNEAHTLIRDWFLNMIEGELYERFK